jgi:hypothetical protein
MEVDLESFPGGLLVLLDTSICLRRQALKPESPKLLMILKLKYILYAVRLGANLGIRCAHLLLDINKNGHTRTFISNSRYHLFAAALVR